MMYSPYQNKTSIFNLTGFQVDIRIIFVRITACKLLSHISSSSDLTHPVISICL